LPDARVALTAALRGDRKRLIETAQALLRVASPNPPGDTSAAAAVAAELLRSIPDVVVELATAQPPFVNVVARLRGSAPGRTLVFNGHLDTFPVGDASRWTRDPLSGEVANLRLHGRGAGDMKGGLAASIRAMALLAECRAAWRGELLVALAADEESMGSWGSKHLLDHVPGVRGDAMLCGDAGSPDVVRFGEKGLVWLEIEADGRPAHGAHVHLGDNAIDRLRAALDALAALRRLKPKPPPTVAQAIRRSKAVSEAISGAGEAATLRSVTVNIGTVVGGVSPNLVPAAAKAGADIRLPVGIDVAQIEAALVERLGPLPGVSYRVLRAFEPNFTDPGHEIVRLVARNAAAATGRKAAVNMRVGASDARWFRLAGVPTVVYGLTPHNMGGPDEYVTLDDLFAVAEVHALTAFDFLAA
jgi:succinyl-diaminopimelate desuccinylase